MPLRTLIVRLNYLLIVPSPSPTLDDPSQEFESSSNTYPAQIGAKTAKFSTQEDTESEDEDEGDEDQLGLHSFRGSHLQGTG